MDADSIFREPVATLKVQGKRQNVGSASDGVLEGKFKNIHQLT